jgi:hypothetical protein
MKKLKLTLNDLRVESYTTAEESAKQVGTVQGHDKPSAPHTCGCPTYYQTCQQGAYTCYNTCDCYTWSGAECNTVCIG